MYLETIYHDHESHQWSLEQKLERNHISSKANIENIFRREFDASFSIWKWCISIDPSSNQVPRYFKTLWHLRFKCSSESLCDTEDSKWVTCTLSLKDFRGRLYGSCSYSLEVLGSLLHIYLGRSKSEKLNWKSDPLSLLVNTDFSPTSNWYEKDNWKVKIKLCIS